MTALGFCIIMVSSQHGDVDDDDGDSPVSKVAKHQPVSTVLAQIALDQALSRADRRLLSRPPTIAIVAVPSADYCESIVEAVGSFCGLALVKTITELERHRGQDRKVGRELLARLEDGRSLVFVTPDPETMLDDAVIAAADLTVTIAAMSPALLRMLIGRMTGGTARGITSEMAKLDLAVVLAAIRPGFTAGQCMAHLERAVIRGKMHLPPADAGSRLTELPLTQEVRDWALPMLSDLEAVKAGTLGPSSLIYGVLAGPPGTGKTTIVASMARSAGWTFERTSVGGWFTSGSGDLGAVAVNIKAFFDACLAKDFCVGFLDEIDAVPDRQSMDNKDRGWWTPIITLILTEIDRVRASGKNVLLLAATNFYSRLDEALVRPGRLQERFPVQPPVTEEDVAAVLQHYLVGDLAQTDLSALTRLAHGKTPAAIEGAIKAARAAARTSGRPLQRRDVLDQLAPKDSRSREDIWGVALHEAGHALIAHRLGLRVESASIVGDSDTGGHVISKLTTTLPTVSHIRDMVTAMLGGRAADILLGNGAHAGAAADLAMATDLLLLAHVNYGLGSTLIAQDQHEVPRSSAIFTQIETELQELLKRAVTILSAERNHALHLARQLAETRVLTRTDIIAVLDPGPASTPLTASELGVRLTTSIADPIDRDRSP